MYRRRLQRQNDAKVKVRLAWYSEDDEDYTYHISRNCPQYSRIRLENLQFRVEHELPTYFELCHYCDSDYDIELYFTR